MDLSPPRAKCTPLAFTDEFLETIDDVGPNPYKGF